MTWLLSFERPEPVELLLLFFLFFFCIRIAVSDFFLISYLKGI
jgi:hypothetical protein